MKTKRALLILGNQLFPLAHVQAAEVDCVFMIEHRFLCRHFAYHQQKLVLVLAAMRSYAKSLQAAGVEVAYHSLDDEESGVSAASSIDEFVEVLQHLSQIHAVTELCHFEVEGKAMQARLEQWALASGIERRVLSSPMFLCDRETFANFLDGRTKVQMASFYKFQRKRLNVLLDSAGGPQGGQWSFDEDNRKKLPKDVDPPAMPLPRQDGVVAQVSEQVMELFPDHPGSVEGFSWPVTRQESLAWLDDFLDQRLTLFGPYEDAISQRSKTLFHSVLSPVLNLGLITPSDIVGRTLAVFREREIPLQSIEGFLRQVIGWREFIRGIHQHFSHQQHHNNFWQHQRQVTDAWYTGDTGIEPLDVAIKEAQQSGWSHHIPRLMVIGNLMTLCEIEPRAVHRWFMEMYVDSSSWVMGPNVYGMGIFSDGGIFATKPYICGSNYLLKMSDYKKGPWCDVMDGLYWRFIDKNRDFFVTNPRLALMPRALDRLKSERRQTIFAAAEDFLAKHTC
jgi:deoxyribodipyrimidine photolyase-related protein